MCYRGRVHNGVVVIEDDVRLPEGAEVDVSLRTAMPHASASEETLYDSLKSFIGSARNLPPDAAANIDRDLYGTGS